MFLFEKENKMKKVVLIMVLLVLSGIFLFSIGIELKGTEVIDPILNETLVEIIPEELVYGLEHIEIESSLINRPDALFSGSWFRTGTSLPYAVDYSNSDLLKYVRKGDILFEAVGFLGLTGHAVLVEGIFYDPTYNQEYIRVIEAIWPGGVSRSILSPERFIDREVEVYRIPSASEAVINGAVDFAISQLGKSFSVKVIKSPSSINTHWYCSELVWASYYNQGIGLATDNGIAAILPVELVHTVYGALIMYYGDSTECFQLNSTNHYITVCGVSVVLPHEMGAIACIQCDYHTHIWSNNGGTITEHYKICTYCHEIVYCSSNATLLSSNASNHTYSCNCGWTNTFSHHFDTSDDCIVCEYHRPHNHSYTSSFVYSNTTKHTSYCLCGDSRLAYHIYTISVSGVQTCLCGYSRSSGAGGFFSSSSDPLDELPEIEIDLSLIDSYYEEEIEW
jgi:hypothetical protein